MYIYTQYVYVYIYACDDNYWKKKRPRISKRTRKSRWEVWREKRKRIDVIIIIINMTILKFEGTCRTKYNITTMHRPWPLYSVRAISWRGCCCPGSGKFSVSSLSIILFLWMSVVCWLKPSSVLRRLSRLWFASSRAALQLECSNGLFGLMIKWTFQALFKDSDRWVSEAWAFILRTSQCFWVIYAVSPPLFLKQSSKAGLQLSILLPQLLRLRHENHGTDS